MSITFGELRYIVANVSFIFAIMTNVRCSCFSSKVLQKVWAVNDKNMDGTRLMNHSILCATEKKGRRENYALRWKNGEKNWGWVETMHRKTMSAREPNTFNAKVTHPISNCLCLAEKL